MRKITIIPTEAMYSLMKFEIQFQDKNGKSSLARTNNPEQAKKLKAKFENDLKQGRLLKPFKSAYK